MERSRVVRDRKGDRPFGGTERFATMSGIQPLTSSLHTSLPVDFLVLSEFAEKKGAVPLHILPAAKTVSSRFNLMLFVQGVMSSDMAEAILDPESGELRRTQWQEMLSQPVHNVYAFVHRFKLFDTAARGNVRTLAISYVTNDPRKIPSNFDDFAREFTKATDSLVAGNLAVFDDNLSDKIKAMRTLKSKLSSLQKHSPQAIDPDLGLPYANITSSVIEEQIAMMQRLRKAAAKRADYPSSALAKRKLDRGGSWLARGVPTFGRSTSPTASGSLGRGNKAGKKAGKHSGTITTPEQPHREAAFADMFKPPTPEEQEALRKRPVSPRKGSGGDARSPKRVLLAEEHARKGRSIISLCGREYFDLSMLHLQRIHLYFRRPNWALLLDKIEKQEMDNSVSLLTVGNTVLMNYRLDKHAVEAPLSSSDKANAASAGVDTTADTLLAVESNGASVPAVEATIPDGVPISPRRPAESGAAASPSRTRGAGAGLGTGEMGRKHASRTRSYLYQIVGDGAPGALPTRRANIIGQGLLTWTAGTRRYALPHLVFSLLTGRPVLVIGRPGVGRDVRRVINMLSIFVPAASIDHGRELINDWEEEALTIEHLARYRLIGYDSSKPLPPIVRRYCTILDADLNKLYAPEYASGRLIFRMLGVEENRVVAYPDETTLLAQIHRCFQELAVASLLYHHLLIAGMVPHDTGRRPRPAAVPGAGSHSRATAERIPSSADDVARRSVDSWGRRSLDMLRRASGDGRGARRRTTGRKDAAGSAVPFSPMVVGNIYNRPNYRAALASFQDGPQELLRYLMLQPDDAKIIVHWSRMVFDHTTSTATPGDAAVAQPLRLDPTPVKVFAAPVTMPGSSVRLAGSKGKTGSRGKRG